MRPFGKSKVHREFLNKLRGEKMLNDKLLYARFILLKIHEHPIFGVGKKFCWPYQPIPLAHASAESLILHNARHLNSWKDVDIIEQFIDDDREAAECTISSLALEPDGPGLADAIFFGHDLKIKGWSLDILICSIFFYELEDNIKHHIEQKRYNSSSSFFSKNGVIHDCLPVSPEELLELFVHAEIGPCLGPLLNQLNLFSEPEAIINAIDWVLSEWFWFIKPDNESFMEQGLANFLTVLGVHFVDASALAKNAIETESLVQLHSFLANYKLEIENQLTRKKERQKEVGNVTEFFESLTLSADESIVIIQQAKNKLENFEPIDVCSSFDNLFLPTYDFYFQDFVNTNTSYLANFLEYITGSSKGLSKKNYKKIIKSYVNSIDEEEFTAFETPYESSQQKKHCLILSYK